MSDLNLVTLSVLFQNQQRLKPQSYGLSQKFWVWNFRKISGKRIY
jgi:hypothetical protein